MAYARPGSCPPVPSLLSNMFESAHRLLPMRFLQMQPSKEHVGRLFKMQLRHTPCCDVVLLIWHEHLQLRHDAGNHGFNGYVPGSMLLSPGLHAVEIDYYQVWYSEGVDSYGGLAQYDCGWGGSTL